MSRINVLTNLNATFKKFRFWTDWVDIAVFTHGYQSYLLQMKVSRLNGKKFNSVKINSAFSPVVSCGYVGNLTQTKAGEE